jgi:hypothetical protein
VFAFGTGLIWGFSFDTTGPVVRDREVLVEPDREAVAADNGRRTADTPTTTDGPVADEPLTADRDAATTSTERTTDRETVK